MSKQDKPTENGEQTKTQKTEAEIAEEKKNAAIKRRLGRRPTKQPKKRKSNASVLKHLPKKTAS